jgi:hypothetical protein
MQPDGKRLVQPLHRTIHLDEGKFKRAVLDELRSMIADFNRSETGR